nr:MAG TPA: hypothetical protein [Caudoviricetes sp.]
MKLCVLGAIALSLLYNDRLASIFLILGVRL